MNNNDRNSEQNKLLHERFESVAVAVQPCEGPVSRVSQFRCKRCGWLSGDLDPLTHQCHEPGEAVVAEPIDDGTTGFTEDAELIQEDQLIE